MNAIDSPERWTGLAARVALLSVLTVPACYASHMRDAADSAAPAPEAGCAAASARCTFEGETSASARLACAVSCTSTTPCEDAVECICATRPLADRADCVHALLFPRAQVNFSDFCCCGATLEEAIRRGSGADGLARIQSVSAGCSDITAR